MPHRYEQYLQRIETEAQEVLSKHELPNTFPDMVAEYKRSGEPVAFQAKGWTSFRAALIISGIENIRKNIEQNRIHKALDWFHKVCGWSMELRLRLNVPAIGDKEKIDNLADWTNRGKTSVNNFKDKCEINRKVVVEETMQYYYQQLRQNKSKTDARVKTQKEMGIKKTEFYARKKEYKAEIPPP
jgi:hypothetical protein